MLGNRTRFVLGLILTLGLMAPVAEAAGKKYALLVGVDRYGKGALLPPLDYPGRDVEGLAEVLIEAGYEKDNVVVMTLKAGAVDVDLQPSAEQIRNQLNLILKPLKPGDSVLILLAGHGVMMEIPPPGGGKALPTSLFCASDASLSKKDLTRFIAIDEVFEALKVCPATTKLLLVDACRNELKQTRPEGRLGGIEMPAPPPPPASVAALFSCNEKEVSWQDAGLNGGHGVFSHFVIEGLKGKADEEAGNRDGSVTLDELTGYVKENVFQFVRVKHATSQEPRLMGNLGRVVLRDRALGILAKKTVAIDQPLIAGPPALALDGVKAGELRDDNALKMKFRWCPPGTFWMGSPASEPERYEHEGPVEVTLSRGFWLGQFEVTQSQWQAVMGTSLREQNEKATYKGLTGEGTDHPMYQVNHDEATEFCSRLTERERRAGRLPSGWVYALPTEAQWEYACRAGTTTATSFGDILSSGDANFDGNMPYNGAAKGPYLKRTSVVGSYRPNAWGLCDMHGNVWEWCQDWFGKALSGGIDPVGPASASYRVIRSGSWILSGRNCRSALRDGIKPMERSEACGFRVARVPQR